MYKYLSVIAIIFICGLTYSQDSEINISGLNKEISIIDFIKYVEDNHNVSFYFNKEDISGLSIILNKDSESLDKILRENLRKKGLSYYISEGNNIYIFPGKPITKTLPEYEPNTDSDNLATTDSTLTNSEKRYIQGKKIASIEVLEIGNKQSTVKNRKCIVNGKIKDKETGEPLVGATLYIKEAEIGVATDLDGNFKIALNSGKYKAFVNYMSMKEQEYYFQVYSDGNIILDMEQQLINIKEVTVSGNRFDNVKGIQMGYEHISAKSIKEIPVVMGEKDLLKVAQMLPGVQNVGEGTSGFNVRGSSADQNMFYVNKIPVYNTSHLFGFFTAFSPDVVSDFSLYKSNIPAKLGGRLASIFEISTRQGNKKELYGQGGISPITGHFSLEGPIVKDKSSFVLSCRSTYSNWILKRVNVNTIQNSSAYFNDFTAGINTEINDKNLFKVFAYRSHDEFSLSTTNDYEYSNTGASANWKHLFSSSLTGDFAFVFSKYSFEVVDENNVSEAYSHAYSLEHYEAKADFLYLTNKNHRFEFGANSIFYNLNRGDILPYGEESTRTPVYLGIENGIEGALYISDEYTILPKLNLMGGLRYSFYGQLGPEDVNIYLSGAAKNDNNIESVKSYSKGQLVKFYSGPEIRTALNYGITPNSSLKLSYNKLRQYIFMLSNTIAMSPTDQWKLCSYHIKPPVADQIALGYYLDFPKKGISTSVEVYKKWIKNIIEYKDGADFISSSSIETQVLQGNQRAHGIEFMLKKNTGKITGWLSYTYSRSFVKVDSDLSEERINYGNEYPSNYDRPHSLNFVSNIRANRRLSMSFNLVYSTGRPITYPVSIYYSEGSAMIQYSDRNEYRIPDYFRMDLSLNLEGNLRRKKLAHSFWMLNVYNLTGRNNAYSIYFENDGTSIQGYKLSIFANPIITLSWNYKFGNYTND